MSALHEFYAGDPRTLVPRLVEGDLAAVRAQAFAYVGFSLPATLVDLGKLTEILAQDEDGKGMNLAELVAAAPQAQDRDDIRLVDDGLVERMAHADPERARDYATAWAEALGEAQGEALPVTREVLRAVKHLILVCRSALSAVENRVILYSTR